MNKQINSSNVAWALSWANQSSAFDTGIKQIQSDANKIMDRLWTAQNKQVDYTTQDKQYLLNNYTKDVTANYNDWAYKNRDFIDKAQTDIQTWLQKFQISDPKLGAYLNEMVLKPYQQANAAAFASYANGMQTIHNTYNSDIDQLYHLNDLSQSMNKITTDQLYANNWAVLQHLTTSQIDQLASDGKISPQDAEFAKSVQVSWAVQWLAQYWVPNAQDTATIQSLIKAGKTPWDAMAQVISDNPARFTNTNLSVVDLWTDPNTGYAIKWVFNPKTGQTTQMSPAQQNTSNLTWASLYQQMMGVHQNGWAWSWDDQDGSHHAQVYNSIINWWWLDAWYKKTYPNWAPVPLAAIKATAAAYNIDPTMFAATMQLDSWLGSNYFWKSSWGKQNNNPWNVWQTSAKSDPNNPQHENVWYATMQDGLNATAQLIANKQNAVTGNNWLTLQGPWQSDKSYNKVGLLSNTDYNPSNASDQDAYTYLDKLLKNWKEPTPSEVMWTSRAANAVLYRKAAQRAVDLYYQATWQSLPDMQNLIANKNLIQANNKILNNQQIISSTIKNNFDLAINWEISNDVNKNAPIVNRLLNPIRNAIWDPATAQALVSNGTITQEFANLLSIRAANGTTVSDKEMADLLIPFGSSVDQQKAIVDRLWREAENLQSAAQSQNWKLWEQIDPLQENSNNPLRQNKISGKLQSVSNNISSDQTDPLWIRKK